MAGPFCAMQLCDMGADVIKVEPPGGDSSRRMKGAVGDDSPGFNAVNRGKRGIVLDLRTVAGQGVFRRLAAGSDIVIENYRPGVMRRLGLDYDTLSAGHPALVYASISGYGQTGPSASKGGFDLVAQGVSGLMSITGEPGGPPVKVGVPLTDLGAGLFALAAILGALHYRTQTGRGQHIDTSLVDAGVALSVWEATAYFSGDGVPEPMGSAHRLIAPYQAIRCADGFITVAAANDRLFERLCAVLGHPEWASDARFRDNTARVRDRAALIQLIEAETLPRSREEMLAWLDANDIPCGPINTYDHVFADAQVKARHMVVETDHPTLGPMQTLGSPMKMSATPVVVGRRAPLLGEHSREILREAGYADDEIASIVGATSRRHEAVTDRQPPKPD
ncbi:MAG: CoA transferase [Luteitalea sp.]|nr:CoA transferase [Luteitalea sp.]